MKEAKVELLTDGHDAEIAQTFYAQRLNLPKGKPVQWGVFAQDFDTNSAALIAIVSGGASPARAAKQIASELEVGIRNWSSENAA